MLDTLYCDLKAWYSRLTPKNQKHLKTLVLVYAGGILLVISLKLFGAVFGIFNDLLMFAWAGLDYLLIFCFPKEAAALHQRYIETEQQAQFINAVAASDAETGDIPWSYLSFFLNLPFQIGAELLTALATVFLGYFPVLEGFDIAGIFVLDPLAILRTIFSFVQFIILFYITRKLKHRLRGLINKRFITPDPTPIWEFNDYY